MALNGDRDTALREGLLRHLPVAANAVIHKGAQVAKNSGGFLVPFTATTGLVACGRAEERVDNTGGANGDVRCKVLSGVFRWDNSAGADEIDHGDIGATAYAVDDHTVAIVSTGRSAAGTIYDVDALGVWVKSTT
jgi:hypothetical protein